MIKEAPHLPTLVGSGVTPDNVDDILAIVDGVIVASSLKHDGVWWNAGRPRPSKGFHGRAEAMTGPAIIVSGRRHDSAKDPAISSP